MKESSVSKDDVFKLVDLVHVYFNFYLFLGFVTVSVVTEWSQSPTPAISLSSAPEEQDGLFIALFIALRGASQNYNGGQRVFFPSYVNGCCSLSCTNRNSKEAFLCVDEKGSN